MGGNGGKWGEMEGNGGKWEGGGGDGETFDVAHGMWVVKGCGGMFFAGNGRKSVLAPTANSPAWSK